MNRNITLLLVIAFALGGCKDQSTIEALQKQGMKALEIQSGSGKKGTVTKTINAGGYTYIEAADDKGEKIWLGLPEMKVSEGDKIEYLDAPPMVNFNSKTLNRKFDKILFVKGIRIEKK